MRLTLTQLELLRLIHPVGDCQFIYEIGNTQRWSKTGAITISHILRLINHFNELGWVNTEKRGRTVEIELTDTGLSIAKAYSLFRKSIPESLLYNQLGKSYDMNSQKIKVKRSCNRVE